jgi:hypothetical protein
MATTNRPFGRELILIEGNDIAPTNLFAYAGNPTQTFMGSAQWSNRGPQGRERRESGEFLYLGTLSDPVVRVEYFEERFDTSGDAVDDTLDQSRTRNAILVRDDYLSQLP